MKRCFIVFSILAVIIALSSCTTNNSPNTEFSVNAARNTADINPSVVSTIEPMQTVEATPTPLPEITIKEQVLYNKNNVKITAKSIDLDAFAGPSIKVLIENDSDKNITVQISSAAVNDFMISTIFSSDVVAGKKSNDEVTLLSSDLEAAGISTIKDIELIFNIFNTESLDTIDISGITHIQTTADPDYVQPVNDSGFVALDKNNVKVVVKKLDDTTSFWGADLYVYVENNSNKDITIQVRKVSLNGFMMNPLFSCQLLPGKKAISSITFMEDDLKNNDITKFQSLEMSFTVFDTKSLDTIFDSSTVKVAFDN